MSKTRFMVECDVARCALGYPDGAFEAWATGEIFQDQVSTDVLAACLASSVVFKAKPATDQTESELIRIARKALIDTDAWTDSRNDEPNWYSPVWGPQEVVSAVGAGFIGFGGFDVAVWLKALETFFPFIVSEAK